MKIEESDRLKVFVAIASFGEKNLTYLTQVIRRYRDMTMDVDIVVTTEASKSVDLGVECIVGTPTSNPHSLPFVHTRLFAERLGRYDLYVYTEDDIEVTEEGIRAFIRAEEVLEANEIAGYLRFEAAPDGSRYLPDVHGRFHWRADSVRERGGDLFAAFTNEHAGFYVLSNDQLRRAIASGRYVTEPYQGRYNMLESAATNLYVNCGFRKVICISRIDQFFVHHMPNNYIGRLGMPFSAFEEQIQTLAKIQRGSHPATTLCAVEPLVLESHWGKRYDESPSEELLGMMPARMKTVLSVGYGCGAAERELRQRGARVTAFPLDSIVGAAASRHGIEVVHGTLEQCLQSVSGRQFDCVMITNLIHLLPQPDKFLHRIAALIAEDGTLVLEGQNFQHLPTLLKRTFRVGDYRKMRTFASSGLQTHSRRAVKRIMKGAGFSITSQRWSDVRLPGPMSGLANRLRRLFARAWVIRAERRQLRRAVVVSDRIAQA